MLSLVVACWKGNKPKTWEMLNWIYLNRKADFVMKSDEDSFVNIPALVSRLNLFQQTFPSEIGKKNFFRKLILLYADHVY